MKDNFPELFVNQKELKIYQKNGEKIIDKLIFGDKLKLADKKHCNKRIPIIYKKNGENKNGYIKRSSLSHIPSNTSSRILELSFIDVGQGDSILIHTPEDKIILVDGGPNKSAYKYICNKYKPKKNKELEIDMVFMTHPDQDHASGLINILKNKNIHVNHFYHNGIIRLDMKKLNIKKNLDSYKKLYPNNSHKNRILTEIGFIYENEEILRYINSDLLNLHEYDYLSQTFKKIVSALKFQNEHHPINVTRLDDRSGILYQDKYISIEILGPINIAKVSENGEETKPEYHYVKSPSKTINGNSISLLLTYDKTKILLCGDMNEEFEKKFIEYYSKKNRDFRVDIFKASHHGSQHFCVEFLEKISPSITVVSSGFQRNYGHPRAVLLGCLGKYSTATQKPLLFCTKISGSYRKYSLKEKIKSILTDQIHNDQIDDEIQEINISTILKALFEGIMEWLKQKKNMTYNKIFSKPFKNIPDNIYEKSLDGSIILRTDGSRIVVGRLYKITKINMNWEIYELDRGDHNILKLKHDPLEELKENCFDS